MSSHSVKIAPIDSRCRYWAKICRLDQSLPMPEQVFGASDIPGPYLHKGEEELLPGDVLFEGECNHHRRMDRGWTYWVTVCQKDGEVLCLKSGFGEEKKWLKQQGMSPEYLKGSGDIAGMVRIAHGMRQGFLLVEPEAKGDSNSPGPVPSEVPKLRA